MHLELRFDPTDEQTATDLAFAERRRYVARAMVPTGYEEYFQDQARFVSAQTSTAIEGNSLDAQEAQLVLIHGADLTEPNEVEARNTENAYAALMRIGSDKSLRVDQGLIRAFNSELLRDLPGRAADRRGTYRAGGSQIVDEATRAPRYNPPPPEWVPDLMADLESNIAEWVRNDPAPVAAAKAHFGLISIHPFEDGNGRTARLLADLILHQGSWLVDGMISISAVLLARRQEYYNALREAQGMDYIDSVDVTPFVRFHTQALTDAVAQLEEKVVTFNMRRDEWTRTAPSTINQRQVIGVMYMTDLGPLSTTTYARLAKCSQPTALSDLQGLMDARLVIRTGAGKSTRYSINPRLQLQSTSSSERGEEAQPVSER